MPKDRYRRGLRETTCLFTYQVLGLESGEGLALEIELKCRRHFQAWRCICPPVRNGTERGEALECHKMEHKYRVS